MSVLTPPSGIKPFETELSFVWFDEEGLFHSVTKKGTRLDKAALEKTFAFIAQNKKTEKILWIGDITQASPAEKEARLFAAQETPKFIKALALITNSFLSKTIADLFLLIHQPPYPTKMFSDVNEAKKWIGQFKDQV